MADAKRQNIVRFVTENGVAIALTLEGPWKFSTGLKPDVNRAICSYKEFDKLGPVLDQVGSIEFWFTRAPGAQSGEQGAPDVSLHKWRIVDVEASELGSPVDATGSSIFVTRIVEYRIFFADFREQLVAPRGGRLRIGLVNSGPKPVAGAPGNLGATNNGVPELTLSQLMGKCLSAMGMPPGVPAAIDAIDAPRDLKWFGNHAPTELAKLLEVGGCTFVPDVSGIGTVQAIATDGRPNIVSGEELPEVEMPSIDRRGKMVIFSSYPLPTLETLALSGPRDDQFYFVAQDSKGVWQKEADCDLLAQGMYSSFIDAFNDNFKNVPEFSRGRFADQCLKFIQLGDGSGVLPEGTAQQDVRPFPPAGVQPIYTRRFEADGSLQNLQIKALSAHYDSSLKQFVMPNAAVEVMVLFKDDKNILQLPWPMVALPDNNPVDDWHGPAIALTPGQMTVRFTVPKYVQQQDGSWTPDFHHIGFVRGAGDTITQLSDDDVANAITAGVNEQDLIFVMRPDLRLRIIDDTPRNTDDLKQQAATLADKYLANSAHPYRLIRCKGFASIELDGLVSEVQWDQEKVMTIAHINNWYRPTGALDAATLLRAESGEAPISFGSAAVDYPNQPKIQEMRTALGEPGAVQPMLPLTPVSTAQPVGAPQIVNVIAPVQARGNQKAGGGFYTGFLYTGTLKADGTVEITMPGGMTKGKACLIFNMEESADQGVTPGTWRLGNDTWAEVARLDQTLPIPANPILEIAATPSMPLAIVNGGTGSTQSLKVLAGSGLNADLTSWFWSTDGKAVKATVQFRTFWDSTGGVLYGYSRDLLWDARGVLNSISGETKYAIDSAVGCS